MTEECVKAGCSRSYHCEREGMVLKWGDTWAVKKNMLRKKRRTGSRREPAGCKRRRTGGLERGYVERKKSSDESKWNFPSLQKAADIWPTHLSRSSFEVLFQHAQLHDITRVPDDCHYGNRVTALDVAVETLHTVETERTRHPQPRLQKQHSTNHTYGIDNESSFTKTALCHVCCSPEFIFFCDVTMLQDLSSYSGVTPTLSHKRKDLKNQWLNSSCGSWSITVPGYWNEWTTERKSFVGSNFVWSFCR